MIKSLFCHFVLAVTVALMSAFCTSCLAQGADPSAQTARLAGNLPEQIVNPSYAKDEKIERMGARLNDEINDLGNTIASFVDVQITALFGNWIDSKTSSGIWLIVLVCSSLTVIVLISERTLRVLNRKIRQRLIRKSGVLSYAEMISNAFSRPLSLLVLSYGLYAAWAPLFHYWARHGGGNMVQEVARRFTNVAASMAPFWLVYRFIGLLDDVFSKRAKETAAVPDTILAVLMRSWRRALRTLSFIIWLRIAMPLLSSSEALLTLMNCGFTLALITTIAWLVIRTTDIFEELILSRYRIDVADNLEARKVHTQIRFLKKVIVIAISVVAFSSMLMMFEQVRQLGASLLASAGVLGIVAGLAVQRSIANLLVGVQVAITQPIRVDDVVVVENEWGQVEEITSTYVVVRIWDLRRLILPITYFTEKPFQNWTRTSADLIATVYVYADYSIPVQAIRDELHRILRDSRLWDGKAWSLQVTDANEQTVELRALMSVSNASNAWNLRCEVREKLISYIQANFTASLPKFRAELTHSTSGNTYYQESSRSRSSNRSSSL